VIISDTTVLITLINIDEFDVLKLFIDQIIIPDEVYHEVSRTTSAKRYLDHEIDSCFIQVAQYQDKQLFKDINYILDDGESASVTLALERKLPLIIDEKKGRRFAQQLGVEIIGLVGILRFLYRDGRLSKAETAEIVKKLNDSNFRISPDLLDLILA